MIETLTQSGNQANIPPEVKKHNSRIDLESFLTTYEGNGKFDASREFLLELRTQTLKKINSINKIAGKGVNGNRLKLLSYVARDLREDIRSMRLFIENSYGLLDGNEESIKEYVNVLEERAQLIDRVLNTGSRDQLYDYLKNITEKIDEIHYKKEQELDRWSNGLDIQDTVLSTVYRVNETMRKVRGSFDCHVGLPLVEGNGSTGLIVEYSIRKSVADGKGRIGIKSKLDKDFLGKRYIKTTISPYNEVDDSLDGKSRYIYNVLGHFYGTIIPDECERTLSLRVKEK